MNIKKIIFILIIIFIIIFSIIIFKGMTKKSKNGNNINSQEIVDCILNIKSYKSKVTVQVNSNKNNNKYVLIQEFNTENGFVQEVLEPENIAGIKIIRKDNNLLIQNTNLDLKRIFENYSGLEENCLDLYNFIDEYKSNSNGSFEEKDNYVIMKEQSNLKNKYIKNKLLYIDKNKGIPIKLVIQDNNQNTTIIIEYNEIELN